jgi:hypothetical protein
MRQPVGRGDRAEGAEHRQIAPVVAGDDLVREEGQQ